MDKFLINTIIPIYNVEEYLEEAIESVINQTIGFEKNIGLILVNDGSSDNSEKICLKYKEKYPNNILYIKQKNKGVSSARNNGLKHVNADYVNFLDGDDKIDVCAYEKAIDFLMKEKNVDFVSLRVKYFDLTNNYHVLDYKFTSDVEIVDIKENYSFIQTVICPLFFRRKCIDNKYFNTKLDYAEDMLFVSNLLLNNSKYGLIKDYCYYYRKRSDRSSATQSSYYNPSYYANIKEAYIDLIDLVIEKHPEYSKYFEYLIMYDMQWRLKCGINPELPLNEKKLYIENVKYLLTKIDDNIILEQRNIKIYYKLLAFHIKYDNKVNISLKDKSLYLNDIEICNVKSLKNIIEVLKIENNKLYIDGKITNLSDDIELFYKLNSSSDYIKINTYPRTKFNTSFGDEYIIKKVGYSLEIPLKDKDYIEFYFKQNNEYYIVSNFFINHSRVSNIKSSYYINDNYMVTKGSRKINISKNPSRFSRIKREIKYYIGIMRNRSQNLKKTKLLSIIFTRLLFFITKPFMPKNIWLFCDREFMGRDNAEALYKYVLKQNDNNEKNYYFVINKKYEDYKRIKKYGKTISYHSLKYKLYFLNAKYLISSHADGYINNAFGPYRAFFIDLYKFKYIYLTHGILLHNSSSWLNRINKDFTLNVVTSPMEYDSIMNGEYYFKSENLIKTGLPRYDNLLSPEQEKNQILFMPSWRSKLTGPVIPGTQRRQYNPDFINSDYYKFYDKLLNDKKLLNLLKEKDYKIKFCIHPSFRAQFNDFKGNEFVEFAIDVDSQYETKVSKLLITDYSSAACDFAYLKKPVIYANFDCDTIFENHYYNQGYFDYDKNGFGPNCKNYDQTLQNIIKTIKNGCVMEDKYKKRCDKFFYYNDNKNCERVYNAILNLEKSDK